MPELSRTAEFGGTPELSDGIDDAGYITDCTVGGGTTPVPSNGGTNAGTNAPDAETTT